MKPLQGKVLFITGATRGIGFAIAKRAALDGAKIVIASKTTEPHPKLENTIFTAAQAIQDLGGEALALELDVRNDEKIADAVAKTLNHFGAIDILINNASAIYLSGTLETPLKRYDLMQCVNTRGTFAMTQACLPALKQAKNPHVLNLSPPLNMNKKWFKNHCAYTISKYGMSMCALGMAAEFKGDGIAVNCLWPKTAIATAAISMLGGEQLLQSSRKPAIVAEAAHWILSQESQRVTGQFFIDEDILRNEQGVTDFTPYSMNPGAKLAPDFFLD